MITIEKIDDIVVNGGVVVANDGARIGSVEQVFLSEDSGDPAFVTVRTGLFGMSESFVPLAGASIDGPRITVAYEKATIRNGPRIESDRGSITSDEENELYRYYGMDEQAEAESSDGYGVSPDDAPRNAAAAPTDHAERGDADVASPRRQGTESGKAAADENGTAGTDDAEPSTPRDPGHHPPHPHGNAPGHHLPPHAQEPGHLPPHAQEPGHLPPHAQEPGHLPPPRGHAPGHHPPPHLLKHEVPGHHHRPPPPPPGDEGSGPPPPPPR